MLDQYGHPSASNRSAILRDVHAVEVVRHRDLPGERTEPALLPRSGDAESDHLDQRLAIPFDDERFARDGALDEVREVGLGFGYFDDSDDAPLNPAKVSSFKGRGSRKGHPRGRVRRRS